MTAYTPDELQAAMMPNPADDVPEHVRPEPMGLSLRMGAVVSHNFDLTRRNVIDILVGADNEVVFWNSDYRLYEAIAWKWRQS